MSFNLDGYVDVATRLRIALDRWPDLRVQEATPHPVMDGTFLAVTVTVWRTADDPLPSVATAWEPFPGTTPYTRNSEAMNAGTSALGRALGYMGIGIDRSIASTNEIATRTEERAHRPQTRPPQPPPAVAGSAPIYTEPDPAGAMPRPMTNKQGAFIHRMCRERGMEPPDDLDDWSSAQASAYIDHLKTLEVKA